MICTYDQYRVEFLIENLLLESKLEFSKGFSGILSSMKGNRIADELLKIVQTKVDLGFTQNYIDVSGEKDMVTFTPDRRASQIIGSGAAKWVTNDDARNKYFTYHKNIEGKFKNRHLFSALGFTPPDHGVCFEPLFGSCSCVAPNAGIEGEIKAETISTVSNKTVVWFVSDSGEDLILNKESISPKNDSLSKIWTTARNPVKIGRLAKSILTVAGVSTTTSEIESFVNRYKSAFDIINDAFSKFRLVSGKDIAYWYNYERYESQESTLGNSCMAGSDSSFFDIYVYNPSVCSLLILFSNDGHISDDGYRSTTIVGRALVWKTQDGDTFMDRIYTNYDSDIDLFKQYAEKNGWWHKTIQNSSHTFNATDGKSIKSPAYVIELKSSDFEYYPYFDTLGYLNLGDKLLSNSCGNINADYELDSTGGSRYEI